MRNLLVAVLLLFATSAFSSPPATVFVLRHAEKLAGDDPELSVQGQARAEAIVDLLIDAGISRIFSTDTKRTRGTAAPLARTLELDVQIYDHKRQADLAAELKMRGENVLVVGHSNTIAEFISAIGGDPGEPVGDDEYDRLYIVSIKADAVSSELRRYGKPQRRD